MPTSKTFAKKIFFCWSILFTAILVSTPIKASELTLAPTIFYFNYKEFSTNGELLDEERGFLGGVTISLSETLGSNWMGWISFTRADGAVNYTGQTQRGQPHRTETHQRLVRLGLGLQKIIPLETLPLTFAFDFSHQKWERGIKPNNGVLGLFEVYQWWEIEPRVNLLLGRRLGGDMLAGLSLFQTLSPQVKVDLSNVNLGKHSLSLGENVGRRFYFSWKWNTPKRWSWGVNAWHSAWEFGKSNTKTIAGPSGLLNISEPSSESRHTAIQVFFSTRYY